jgi:hypothetical protein
LAAFPVPYRIVQSPELVEAARAIAAGLLAAVDGSP